MMRNWKKIFCRALPFVLGIFFAEFFLFSCSNSTEPASFLSALDKVDSYIRTAQTSDALKLLNKTSKSAYSAYARIGIYRRYMTLGEKALAEKTLKKALKKIPQNLELSALYGVFLLRDGRLSEALSVSQCLSGTKYGSIYSECVLKTVEKDFLHLLNPKMASVFNDAYNATQDERWLINAVLPFLAAGDYANAASMQQSLESDFSLFWAQVQYDSGKFDLCIENLDRIKSSQISGATALLASDAYYRLGDFDSAEKERSKLLALSDLEYNVQVPEILAVNSAIWSYNAKNYSRAYDLLSSIVLKNTDSVPALVTYGKFAWEDSFLHEEDNLERALRKARLRSLSMKQNDERPRFLIDDAIFRIDENIKKNKLAGKTAYDELIVEKLSLFLRANSNLPVENLCAEIWRTLEQNELGTDLYPPLLVNFAVDELLKYSRTDDARRLFSKYLDARYKMKDDSATKEDTVRYDIFGGEKKYTAPVVPDFVIKAAFGDRAAQYSNTMEIWEVETAAYFTLLDGNVNAARRLYEYALFETGGVKMLQKKDSIIAISPLAGVSSAMNLAMIYSSTGELEKSLSLYGLASGRTRDKQLKSKILYRTALVQNDLKNTNGAILSLDYAVSLDPLNAEARLFRKKLKGISKN